MKFDELIKKTKGIKAPDLSKDSNKTKSENMDILITQLEKVDFKVRFSARALQIFYTIMIFVFLLYLVIIEDFIFFKYGLFFAIATFLLGIFAQQRRYDKFNKTYTNQPINEFLYKAKRKLNVYNNYILNVPIWILMDIAICFFTIGLFPHHDNIVQKILFAQLFILIVIGLEILEMYFRWRKKYKPTLDEIEKMIEEVENA